MLNKYFVSEQKEFNDNDRTLIAWATTDDVDRDGESLSADGWDLKAFRKNSVLMACHDYQRFPVGKVEWIKPDPVENPKGLKFKAQFAETDEGLDAWYLYRNGYMNAFSVGFNPLEEPIFDDKADGKKKPRRRYCKNELLEISCVPVPANAMALVEAGKSMKTKAFQEIIKKITTENKQMGTPDQISQIWSKANEIQVIFSDMGSGGIFVTKDRLELCQTDPEASDDWYMRGYKPDKKKNTEISASDLGAFQDDDDIQVDDPMIVDVDALDGEGDTLEVLVGVGDVQVDVEPEINVEI